MFQTQVELVCQTYLDAPDLYFQYNTYTVSTDEMSIQALQRIGGHDPDATRTASTDGVRIHAKRDDVSDRQLGCNAGSNDRANDSRDSHQHRFYVAHFSHRPDGPRSEFCVPGGSTEHPL